ncbi:RluA family pseudouridine synthase [Patescibacteria group bacterium]|nr:RluA family pseudouridine synthase [Patescibacteria group bacterium]
MKTIYEDENIIVLDKPAGIAVFSDNNSGLMAELTQANPELENVGEPPRYGLIHRLDKDTSGLLLVAKNNPALSFFQKQFRTREVHKKYIALVAGEIKEKEGVIKTLIGRSKDGIKQQASLSAGPESKKSGPRLAETFWKVIKRYNGYSLVETIPKTGRKHQIRVHLSRIGHPISGDKLYSFKNQTAPKGLKRQFLHASELTIKLVNGEEKTFSSPLPDDLKQLLQNL